MVEFREITEDNYEDCLNLKVSDSQKSFVASNVYSLAEAWVFHETAYPFAIYGDDKMVGFIMMGFYKPKGVYTIWRFMIDERFQGQGYGKAAILLAIEYLKNRFNLNEIYTSFVIGNNTAERLYYSVGFRQTGEIENGQIGMCLKTK